MAALPKTNSVPERIFQARQERQGAGNRPHLGCSLLGDSCERKLWYGFRWAKSPNFSGRVLRLFERGQREEEVFVRELVLIGCEVHERDLETGEQYRVSAVGGHVGGSMDGVAIGIPEAPKTWHLCEFKTHSDKYFKQLVKEGVEKSHPKHYAQMQLYMYLGGLKRALYLAVNKNDDDLYAERVRLDEKYAAALVDKAAYIVSATEPPARLSENPAWYECKFCDYSTLCHEGAIPEPCCRTCCHATPDVTGTEGAWRCAMFPEDGAIPLDVQANGCERHCFIPALLPWQAIDATDSGVVYHVGAQPADLEDKHFLENGPGGVSSAQLYEGGREFWEASIARAVMATFEGAEVVQP